MEPLPEGRWYVGDMLWADGKDNYTGHIWKRGLGPVKIYLDYKQPGTTQRTFIEIHLDWNRKHSPGTAGLCRHPYRGRLQEARDLAARYRPA